MNKRWPAFLTAAVFLLAYVWAAAEPVTVRPGPFAFQYTAGNAPSRAISGKAARTARRLPASATDGKHAVPSAAVPAVPWVGIQRQTGAQTMQVTISCTCTNKNHVGNEWVMAYHINDQPVETGQTVELTQAQGVHFTTEITEIDEYSDYSIENEYYTVTPDDLTYGFSCSITVAVVETHGKYKGNVAEWTVTYTFLPMR